MSVVHTYGIDPGTHTTGIVKLCLDTESRAFSTQHDVVVTPPHVVHKGEIIDLHRRHVHSWLLKTRQKSAGLHSYLGFVEDYRSRGNNLSTNTTMQELVKDLVGLRPWMKRLDNTGSRQVVRSQLLDLLGLDNFPATHHQDLQAAARILIYGLLKHGRGNAMLYDIVESHLNGRDTWRRV